MPNKNFISLNRKLAVAVLASAMCLAALAMAFTYVLTLARAQVKETVMINQLLDTVEYSTAIAAYSNNKQIAQDVIQGLLRNDIVNKVRITGDQGLVIEQQNNSTPSDSKEVTRKLFSPFDNRRIIGAISVVAQSDYSFEEAKNSALVSGLNSFALIVLTTLIILFVVNRNIVQPLALVSNTLHAISAGERERISPFAKHKDDELGRLTSDINQLLEALESKFTNERSLREKIQLIEKQLRNIFESTSAGLFLLDQNGKLITYNPTLLRILSGGNLADADLVNIEFADLFFENPKQVSQTFLSAMQSEQLESCDLALHKQADGISKWVHCLVSKTYDDYGNPRLEGVIFDVTKRIAAENTMRYQAEYDNLTGLLRKNSGETKLIELLADPQKAPIVVMVLDLDGFKAVNDTYGHNAGDEVLIEVAQRFTKNVRGDDVVARLGGDEFLIILNKCEPINVELVIAEKIIRAIQQPITLKSNVDVFVGTSIGIASNLGMDEDAATLIKAADEAMYAVKRQGKNGFAININNDDKNIVKLFPALSANVLET